MVHARVLNDEDNLLVGTSASLVGEKLDPGHEKIHQAVPGRTANIDQTSAESRPG